MRWPLATALPHPLARSPNAKPAMVNAGCTNSATDVSCPGVISPRSVIHALKPTMPRLHSHATQNLAKPSHTSTRRCVSIKRFAFAVSA